jgi:hypothetical protein
MTVRELPALQNLRRPHIIRLDRIPGSNSIGFSREQTRDCGVKNAGLPLL